MCASAVSLMMDLFYMDSVQRLINSWLTRVAIQFDIDDCVLVLAGVGPIGLVVDTDDCCGYISYVNSY